MTFKKSLEARETTHKQKINRPSPCFFSCLPCHKDFLNKIASPGFNFDRRTSASDRDEGKVSDMLDKNLNFS